MWVCPSILSRLLQPVCGTQPQMHLFWLKASQIDSIQKTLKRTFKAHGHCNQDTCQPVQKCGCFGSQDSSVCLWLIILCCVFFSTTLTPDSNGGTFFIQSCVSQRVELRTILVSKQLDLLRMHPFPYQIMTLSPVTNEPVYLWNLPQSFVAPVPTCLCVYV